MAGNVTFGVRIEGEVLAPESGLDSRLPVNAIKVQRPKTIEIRKAYQENITSEWVPVLLWAAKSFPNVIVRASTPVDSVINCLATS